MRDDYFDSLKGIAILSVIAIHAIPASLTDPAAFSLTISTFSRQFINFPVFLFFAIAGYFVELSRMRGKPFKVLPRITRIVVPYVVATILTVVTLRPESLESIYSLLDIFLAGKGISIGYYIIVLAQFTVITPFLLKIKTARMHLVVMLLGTAIGFAWTYSLTFIYHDWSISEFPYRVIPFFVWYPSYHLGIFLARFREKICPNKGLFLSFVVVAISFSLLEAAVLNLLGSALASSQTKASSIFLSLIIAVGALGLQRGRDNIIGSSSVLSAFGRMSFFIYLYHLPAMDISVRILKIFTSEPAVIVVASWVLTASISFGLALLCRQILGEKRSAFYFGA